MKYWPMQGNHPGTCKASNFDCRRYFRPRPRLASIMLTIEVIEDDVAMRTLISEWLHAEGYRVRAESHIVDERRTDVDLVVVNLGNLHLDGIETVRRVRRTYANAALIGVSTQVSRTLAVDSEQAQTLGLARLVSKPCRSSELLGAVMDAIGPAT
jgi:CheY-like chemotaxis protein